MMVTYNRRAGTPLVGGSALKFGPCKQSIPRRRLTAGEIGSMTFAAAFLLGSMFGACVGFIAAGAARTLGSGNDELASVARRNVPAAMR
jgi:hypothetical protein